MVKHDSGWKRFYANIIKTWTVGYGSVLGRFQGIINLILLASTYLIAKGFELSFVESIVFGIGLLVFVMVSGYIYLKMDLQKSEFSSNIREQPEMLKLFNDVEEIKAMLKKQQ